MIAGQARGGKGGSELVAESDGIREEVTERPLFVTWATRRISVASRPDARKDMCRAPHNVLLTTRNSPLFVMSLLFDVPCTAHRALRATTTHCPTHQLITTHHAAIITHHYSHQQPDAVTRSKTCRARPMRIPALKRTAAVMLITSWISTGHRWCDQPGSCNALSRAANHSHPAPI